METRLPNGEVISTDTDCGIASRDSEAVRLHRDLVRLKLDEWRQIQARTWIPRMMSTSDPYVTRGLVTLPGEATESEDNVLLARLHRAKVRARLEGRRGFKTVRPDATARVTLFGDNLSWPVSHSGNPAVSLHRMKLEWCKKRALFLRLHYHAYEHPLARTLWALREKSFGPAQELAYINGSPLWAIREYTILQRAIIHHRTNLMLLGSLESMNDDIALARKRAKSAARSRRYRERNK